LSNKNVLIKKTILKRKKRVGSTSGATYPQLKKWFNKEMEGDGLVPPSGGHPQGDAPTNSRPSPMKQRQSEQKRRI